MAGAVAALSVVSDLTRGHPPGEAMRACVLATELARRSGLEPAEQADVYYATLMRFAGCAATSHESAAAFGGDDIAVRARGDLIDATRPWEAVGFLAGLGSGLGRVRMLARAPQVPTLVREGARADCEVGVDLTRRLSLPDAVPRAVQCAFERFDGKGSPEGLAGDEVSLAARYAAVGYAVVMFEAVGGRDAAVRTVSAWSGRALDPAIARAFLDDPDGLVALSRPSDVWEAVVTAEPGPARSFRDDAQLDEVLAGFGDVADLKAPFFQGHSGGVARLARVAAELVGVDPVLVHRAGLVHDLGRVAVPTGVWERPGALSADEWEMVRLHPYDSGRILSRSPLLRDLAVLASRHHERVDGSGYPAGVGVGELDPAAQLLAAADTWQALGEQRPHRAAMPASEAARVIAELPLDRRSVRAVLQAAEAPRASLPRLPVDLTARELEILGLLVLGRTKREIAAQLVVSHSTVHTHTVHIYAKCQVSTRAGLAMFAMRHGLAAARP